MSEHIVPRKTYWIVWALLMILMIITAAISRVPLGALNTPIALAIATVKALAMALDLPVAAVPTLDALAARLPFADAPVCPILDARKGEVYLSLYRWREGGMAREWEYLALPPELAAARIIAPVILLGDGLDACRPWLDRLGAAVRVAPAP